MVYDFNLPSNYSIQETEEAEFERKREEAEATAEAKTSKNRAKRQKKKERSKKGGAAAEDKADSSTGHGDKEGGSAPIKKRRLVNGKELVFRRPGEDSDDEGDEGAPAPSTEPLVNEEQIADVPQVLDTPRIIIHEDD